MGVDIHAFPPDLPPRPDEDDIGGDELDHTEATHTAPLERVDGTEPAPADAGSRMGAGHACDYCGGPAALGIYYLADGAKEWACYPCHATVIAQALNAAADEAEAGAAS